MYAQNLLEKRMTIAAQMTDKISTYFDVIKDMIVKIDPKAHNKFMNALILIKDSVHEIQNIKIAANNPTDWLKLGQYLYNLLGNIKEMYPVIHDSLVNEKYLKMAIYNMSATYSLEIETNRITALNLLQQYYETCVDDAEIIDIILDKVNLQTNIPTVLLFINDNEKMVNKFMIEVLRETIKHVNGDSKQRLLDLIEQQKNILFNSQRLVLKYRGPQSPLVRYGLCPKTLSMPIWELFELIGAKWRSKTDIKDNFRQLATELHSHIFVIDKIASSPIEFDIRGLVSIEYITQNDLKTNPTNGLNKKILERYNTIKELPTGNTLMKFAVTRFLIPNAKQAYIIETLNGNLYRLMSNTKELYADIDSVRGLINGLSTRPIVYGHLHEMDIINKCFDEKSHIILNAYNEQVHAAPASYIVKEKVISDFMEEYEKVINQHIPISPSEFRDMVTGNTNSINEILLYRLSHSIKTPEKGRAEYIITYMAKFDGIIRQFIKVLENKYNMYSISELLFKERTGNDLKQYLLAICKDIIVKVVNELDRAKQWTDYDISIKEFFLESKHEIV